MHGSEEKPSLIPDKLGWGENEGIQIWIYEKFEMRFSGQILNVQVLWGGTLGRGQGGGGVMKQIISDVVDGAV